MSRRPLFLNVLMLAMVCAGLVGLAFRPSAATAAPNPPSAKTWYVRTNGSNVQCNGKVNTGFSPAVAPNCAWLTLQWANDAASTGDRVRVSAGTYTSNDPAAVLRITKGIRFLGPNEGIDPTPEGALRAPEAIIDGEQQRTGVAILSRAAILDGFTVREGGAVFTGSYPASIYVSGYDRWAVRYNIIEPGTEWTGAVTIGIAVASCSALAGASGCAIEYNRIRAAGVLPHMIELLGPTRHLTIRGNDAASMWALSVFANDTEGGHRNLTIVENALSSISLYSVNHADVSRNLFDHSISHAIHLKLTNKVRIRNNQFNYYGISLITGNEGVDITENAFREPLDGSEPAALRVDLGNVGTVKMSLNWYSSPAGPDFDPIEENQPPHIRDHRPVFDVDYEPWLCSGEDIDPATPGFQPDLTSLGTNASPCAQ